MNWEAISALGQIVGAIAVVISVVYLATQVRGNARLEPDDDYAFAGRVGTKYDADLKVHNRPGDSRVVVTIEAINVYAVDMGGG